MTILRKKICLIGDFAVGKTSLVARYVKNVFSEKYLTTVGVKIDTKEVPLDGDQILKMIIWDIAGKDRLSTADDQYLRGAAGFMLVADGTRGHTLQTATDLKNRIFEILGPVPFVFLINKCDLADWEVSQADMDTLAETGWPLLRTSAKDGTNVEHAFQHLARKLVEQTCKYP